MKKQFCFISLVLLSLCACRQSSDLVHLIEMKDIQWQADYIPSGTNIRMHMIAQTENSTVANIKTTAYDVQHGDYTILDTTFAYPSSTVDFYYHYTTPMFMDTTTMYVTSVMTTATGEQIRYRFNLHVLPAAVKMHTLDAVTMYSAESGGKYGFSLVTLNTLYPETQTTIPSVLQKDQLVFFDRAQADSTQLDKMSCEWESTSGVYFARFESFDYSEATVASIQRAYDICKRDNIIKGIRNDDVILFGTKSQALGALKVLIVADEAGSANDRYIFAMKTFLQ